MGIQGLLPTLKSIMNPRHVRDYAGKRAAVDTYSWLHKAAFSCSKDICLGRLNDKYIDYCMHRVNMLRHYGVQPVLVFDGGGLPMKSDQEIKRARSRKENLDRALEHERLGNQSAAYECYQKAVDITSAIAFRLIKVLRQENVEYVVAPYEADAQMAFLARHAHVDLVITEDSDLIAYGCPQILFKMDKYGQGVGFQSIDITANKDLDFNNFSQQMVLEMCILSGCDYLSSLPGMGVKRAHGLIKRFKTYQKVIKHLKFSGVLIDQQYEQGFQRAILTFQHHRVYDPAKREMVHLADLPSELDTELDFLGPYISQTVAIAIARGEVDPTTYEPFEDMSCSEMPGTASKAKVPRGFFPNMEVERSSPKNALITTFFQGPGESAKKQFRPPRNTADSASSHSQANEEEFTPSQFTPSPTLTSQTYSSPFSKFSFTSQQSPVFGTPPSQVLSPFVSQELDLDEGLLPRIIDLTSDYPPLEHPLKRTDSLSEDKQKDSNPSPLAMDSRVTTSKPVEKAKAALAPPLLQHMAAAQPMKLRVDFNGAKKSAYFSRSSPSQLQLDPPVGPTSSGVSPEVDHHKCNNADVLDLSEDSLPSVPPEGVEIEYDTECFNHGNKVLKDITNNKQTDAIAAGKRKHVPHFRSDLLGERPVKCRPFSSVSHVGQYAGLAQRSMDDFVSALAPFRRSQSGSRVSGLRAPAKQGMPASGSRAPSKSAHKASTSRAVTTTGLSKRISDFVHSSPVNMRRLTFPDTTPIAAGSLRWQVYNEADWEKA